MRRGDAEFVQILNIIRRGQQLIIQAKKEGADTSMAEEFISESKYALKMNKREQAIEYSKKAIFEIVRAKRELTKQSIKSKDDLNKLTKSELRNLCIQYELDTIGVKEELVKRIWEHLRSMPEKEEVREEVAAPPPDKPVEIPSEPEPETAAPEPQDVPLDQPESAPVPEIEWDPSLASQEFIPGISYLVEEKRPDRFFRMYEHLKKSGGTGVVISRTNPKILARKYGISEKEAVWLTGKEIFGDIRTVLPILEFIFSHIEEFMDNNSQGVIMLDGLEYLLTNNKFNSVLRFLRQLVDNVSQTENTLLVALSPDALDPSQVTLLEKDLTPVNYLSE
ncbi:MAG: DUF835 domain-containing protein [Thermoplasmatota archaeon]